MDREMGLRERKRRAAMRRIQAVALDLFDRHGYQQVSVERIASQAEVSASSVYRYFGTKEQIVLWDEYDPVLLERLAEELQQHPVLAALRTVMRNVIEEMVRQDEPQVRQRIQLMMQEPAIAAATAVAAQEMAGMMTEVLADGLGRPRSDVELHLLAYGLVGATIGAMRCWYTAGFRPSLPDIMDQLVGSFERGFPVRDQLAPPTR